MIRKHRPARTLQRVLALGLTSIAGLVGMLLADGLWDGLFFILAALPISAAITIRQAHRKR